MNDPESIVERVTEAVAAATDRPREELPTLYESVDTDALVGLFGHAAERPNARPTVEFAYAGCVIRITPDEVAVVDDAGDRDGQSSVGSRSLP